MKESNRKGLAIHPGSESCVASLKAAIGASKGPCPIWGTKLPAIGSLRFWSVMASSRRRGRSTYSASTRVPSKAMTFMSRSHEPWPHALKPGTITGSIFPVATSIK